MIGVLGMPLEKALGRLGMALTADGKARNFLGEKVTLADVMVGGALIRAGNFLMAANREAREEKTPVCVSDYLAIFSSTNSISSSSQRINHLPIELSLQQTIQLIITISIKTESLG